MKEFFIYFFGQGEVQEFALFTPAHILPILLYSIITTAAAVVSFLRQMKRQ